ncbi:DTW domain-containing protein [Shewanella baltica]|uniref:tRNA-uridine aminocarboxypropyltransferase n=2 Tax=Shewanella baltica TaxID=62322 RepID=UPI0009B60BA9|nr:tRNA-uridine aminocarboxypropyltransferase [Shewanella baltica]MCS6113129.1 DTW domain-containing protein [Shewanella baltica]UVW64165.1 DTW domain-containing protein [Shewanella baltica]
MFNVISHSFAAARKAMQIILLTHERELSRKTNTGQLALAAFPEEVKSIVWSRTAPDNDLVAMLASQQAKLLFPASDTEPAVPIDQNALDTDLAESTLSNAQAFLAPAQSIVIAELMPSQVVILDATWQEARKMLRQSAYLKTAARVSLPPLMPESAFILRRNQQEGGLCTAECIIALWRQCGRAEQATLLASLFTELNSRT